MQVFNKKRIILIQDFETMKLNADLKNFILNANTLGQVYFDKIL